MVYLFRGRGGELFVVTHPTTKPKQAVVKDFDQAMQLACGRPDQAIGMMVERMGYEEVDFQQIGV